MAEGAAGTAVKLGLTLDLSQFASGILTAEQELQSLASNAKSQYKVKLQAALDTSVVESELTEARKLINGTKANIKVGTTFYKGGSQYAVTKTALLREILTPLQNNIKDDRKYQLKIGAYISGDIDVDQFLQEAQAKLNGKPLEIKVKANLSSDIDQALKTATENAKGLAAAYRDIAAAAAQAATAARTVTGPAATTRRTQAPPAQQQFDSGAARQALTQLTKTEGQGGLNPAALRELQKAAASSGIQASATGATELRKELAAAFAGAGDDAIKGLALSLAKGEIQIEGATDGVGKALIQALKKSLGIASPSKETKKLGGFSADGFGLGFVGGMVRWERQMAQAIRQAVGNAISDGTGRHRAATGALTKFGTDAGSTIATSLAKALKQGLASSVAPALKGGLLGATGGAATGGLVGGIGAAAGAAKAAVMPSLLTFGYGSTLDKVGMLGKGAANLASGGANEAINTFLQNSVQTVLDAALSTGGQGALLGAAGVAGVAGMAGLAKGASGSLVMQAVEAIKNRILGTAAKEAQAQAQVTGPGGARSTGGAITAPIENAGNMLGTLGGALQKISQALVVTAKELAPGRLRDRWTDLIWNIDQAAQSFGLAADNAKFVAGKVSRAWGGFTGNGPMPAMPPSPVPGTGLVRQDNMQLGEVVGRTPLGTAAYGRDGGLIGPSELSESKGYLAQTRKILEPIGPNHWKIVTEVNGIWQRIKSDTELAEEFQQRIAQALSSQLNTLRRNRDGNVVGGADVRAYTGDTAPGMFNPFDKAFYRPTRDAEEPPYKAESNWGTTIGKTTPMEWRNVNGEWKKVNAPNPDGRQWFGPTGGGGAGGGAGGGGGGGNFAFGADRFGKPDPAGALAMRNVPVEFFRSFKDAEKLLATVAQRLAAVASAFDLLKVKSQIQVNQGILGINASLRAAEIAFTKGEISGKDFIAATYGASRELAGLGAQTAEVQNLAQAFNDLGIESNAALKTINDQRNLALNFIQDNPNILDSEKTRASNARDIQQATFVNDQIRVAQSASGFGGFRGREIGNKTLIDRQQRSELANAIRQLEEYGNQITRTGYNTETFKDIQKATAAEIKNAEMALRVLQDQARDGERITLAARNAWGTILDDFKNLVPQLLVFAVAYNLILQRVMSTPGAVIQASAAFDQLNTSIGSYLSATRGIGDASAELDKVRSVAMDLGVGYEKAAKSYLSFAAATQGTTLEGREADISRTLFTAGRNQGLNGEQLDRAATALTQILSKGRVQAEELRGQLAEQLPGAVQVAARAYGVTTKELYRMVEAGQLASDEFVDKFMKQLVAEGADVNQLAGSFTNVTEQLGVSIQALAASAGAPILSPLTQALRLLNTIVTGLIPVGAPLAALFAGIGINAFKSALQIKSLTKEAGGVAGMLMGMPAAGAGEPSRFGPDGRLLNPREPGVREKVGTGARQAGAGLRDAVGAVTGGKGMGEINKGLKDMTAGLKSATVATVPLGTGLKAALAPAVKILVFFEALNLVIKGLNGELSALNNEMRKSNRIVDGNEKGPEKLNFGQQILSRLNIGKNLENFGTLSDASTISGNTATLSKRLEANKGLIKKTADEVSKIDRQLFDERQKLNVTQTDEERKASAERIKALEKQKEAATKALKDNGITGSGVRAQVAIGQAAEQALKATIDRRVSQGFDPVAERNQLRILEERNKKLREQAKELENINRINSLAGIESKLKGFQENLGREDIDTANFTKWQAKVAGLQKVASDQQLLPEEQKLMELEAAQRLITAEMERQEAVAKTKLGILDNERKQLEANLALEQTRTKLQEALANRRVQVARALNDPSEALKAEAAARKVRDAGQERELAGQSQLIEKDRERARIESMLQREQITLQRQQVAISLQMLEVEKAKLMAAIETGEGSARLQGTYKRTLALLNQTITTTKAQTGEQSKLIPLLDAQLETQESVFDTQQQQIGAQRDLNQANSETEARLGRIEEANNMIGAAELLRLSTLRSYNEQLNAQTEAAQNRLEADRAGIEVQRERLRMAEELASVEMEAIDRLLNMQTGQFEGGFFERMAKFSEIGNSTESDALALAQRRAQLMRQIKDQQDKQKIAELGLKQKELEAEKVLLGLKVAQLRIANEEARTRLRSTGERLRMAFASRGDQLGFQQTNDAMTALGGNAGGPYANGDMLTAQLGEWLNDLQSNTASGNAITQYEAQANLAFEARVQGLKDQISFTNELNAATDKLLDLDASAWFARFLDESTAMGRVLSVAAQGISEFRSSVSSGLVQGLLGGDGASAISDAGKQFAEKMLTSIVDEFVMKPMEKNLFAGLSKIFGMKQPETEQQKIVSNTQEQAAVARDTNTAIGKLDGSLGSIDQGLKTGVERIVAAILQQPSTAPQAALLGPQATAPAPQAAPQALAGTPIRGAVTNRTRDPDAEATGWDVVVPGGVGGRVSNPFGSMKVTGTGFQGSGAGPSGRGYGKWMSGEVEVAGKIYEVLLGHFKNLNVKAGDILGPGATIGQQGETGRTFGEHVTTHVNPKAGASVGDAWGTLEKLTRAWETGTIVPNSGKPLPVSVVGAPPAPVLPPPQTLAAGASAPVPVVVTNPQPGVTGPVPLQVQNYQEPITGLTGGFNFDDSMMKEMVDAETTLSDWNSSLGAQFPILDSLNSEIENAGTAIAGIATSAQPVPQGFQGLGQALGGVVGVLGSIGMGIAGIQQMGKGGTYNTLMGLAGIFGAIGGITGAFGKGGSLSGLFRASGGPVTARRPYIVGEQGPELMVPERSGTVMSNSRTNNVLASTRAALEAQRTTNRDRGMTDDPASVNGSIDVRYQSEVINNVEYVTVDQFRSGMKNAAERGKAMALYQMQNSVKTRRRLSI
jgi:tape measure domain-containing protein